MAIQITRQDGTEALNDREPFLRLYQEGQVTPSGGGVEDVDDNFWNEYVIPIPPDIQGKTIFVFVKSDFEEFFCQTDSDNFAFYTKQNLTKDYKIYANYSFENYTVSTGYGAKIFDPNGNVVYDSRVPEAVYLDHFVVTENGGPYYHTSVSEAWYSVSTYSARFHLQCGTSGSVPGGFISRFLIQTLQQVSSTEVQSGLFVSKDAIVDCINQESAYTFPTMLLDPSYL